MFTHRRVSFLVAAALCAAAPAVHAESRAWTAAKKALPGGLQVVGGINVSSLKASQLYQQLMPTMMAQAGQAKDHFDKIKATCGLDFTGSIDSIAFGLDAEQKGGFVIALKGTNQSALEACGQKMAAAENKKLTVSKDGAYTRYGGFGDKDVLVKWLAKDTLALATEQDDKALLDKMLAGGVDKDAGFKARLASVNTSAAVWAVVNKSQDLTDFNTKMIASYGSADVKAGNIDANVHIVVDNAKAATDAAAKMNKQLDDAKKGGQLPPQLASLLKAVAIKAGGAEIVITASASEKDVLSLLAMFMGGGGSGSH